MTTPTPEEVAEKLARKSVEAILDSLRTDGFDPRWDSADESDLAKSLAALLLEYEQLRRAARHVLDQFTPQHIDAVSGTNVGSKLIESLTALNTALREKGIEP